MIIEKTPLPEDPTPSEAPPSYDTHTVPSPLTARYANEKSLAIESDLSPSSSSLTSDNQKPYQRTSSSSSSAKGKGRSAWFGFTTRPAREVRVTVLGLVRDLVSLHQASSTESRAILDSCVEACNAYDLSFSSLLQEKSIESHTPLYWAIVKRPSEDSDSDTQRDEGHGPDLLTTMLSYAAPLSLATLSEIRLACLLTSDQALFQRLRLSPEFSPVSGTDAILLGAVTPPDVIKVEDVPGDEGAFTVTFEIAHFQKRMRISKRIELEFIARSRMWRLLFFVASDKATLARPGSWCVAIHLMENSPPTWLDSCVSIPEVMPIPEPGSLIDAELPSAKSQPQRGGSLIGKVLSANGQKPKPPITIRLKSSGGPLVALGETKKSYTDQTEILVSLDESSLGGSLQFAYVVILFLPDVTPTAFTLSGNSYIGPDGSLKAFLNAKLSKPDADQGECVVC